MLFMLYTLRISLGPSKKPEFDSEKHRLLDWLSSPKVSSEIPADSPVRWVVSKSFVSNLGNDPI